MLWWSPDFNNEFSDSSSSEEEYVDEEAGHVRDNRIAVSFRNELSPNSKDPFGIYELLNRHKEMQNSKGDDPTFPPGKLIMELLTSISYALRNLWVISFLDFAFSPSVGSWTSFYLLTLLIVYVYAPQDLSERKSLWDYIHHMIDQWVGESVILGDFNEVRSEHERFLDGYLGFDKLVEDSWKNTILMESNNITLRKKKFHALKLCYSIKTGVKMNKTVIIQCVLNMAQKAKIRWAIEGDENSKFFHGIINKKRSQLAIRGVLVDGEWIDEPSKVKNKFFTHFSNQFSKPTGPSIYLESQMFRHVSFEQNVDLESNVTYDEIRKAIIDRDVVNAVQEFFASSHFPPGTNSLFITLIPKKQDSKVVKDYRPISLIGLFKGIRINSSITLSHLFYADDAVFIGKWDKANFTDIVQVLKCFFLASGLKINIHKSKLMGIGIAQEEVSVAANLIGSIYGDHGSLDNPGSVSRSSPWCTIICEIGNLSLKGTNLLSHMKKKVGNGIHTSFWGDPWLYDMSLLQVFPRLYALECNKQVSVAVKLSEGSLTDSFRREPRGGIEEEQLLLLSNKLASVTLANSNDRWIWLLDSSGEFSVKSVRSYIDDTLLPTVGFPTRW
ncbi:hypothetical protein Tco_1037058 [Tanacetum coccineum]